MPKSPIHRVRIAFVRVALPLLGVIGLAPRRRLDRALAERDVARARHNDAVGQRDAARAERDRARRERNALVNVDQPSVDDELAWVVALRTEAEQARSERDASRRLQQTQARLWRDSAGAGNDDGDGLGLAADSLTRHGRFSSWLFERQVDDLTASSNPFLLGDKVRLRVAGAAAPVRFRTPADPDAPPPNVGFACVCTDAFVPGLEALLASLHEVYTGFDNEFVVFHDGGLSDFNQARLELLHPAIRFEERATDPYLSVAGGDSPNQRRIGAIGYLNIEALRLGTFDRVVLLDSDLLVTSDISELWRDPLATDVRVVADAGVVPMANRSDLTGRLIFNSGVISLPAKLLGDETYRSVIDALPETMDVECERLQEFADQRFWNVFIAGYPEVSYLSSSLNANKRLVERHVPGQLGTASIIHFTGQKPWFNFVNQESVKDVDRRQAASARARFPLTFALWDATYRRAVGRSRRAAFDAAMGDELRRLRDSQHGGAAVLIGNGPSLAHTDLGALSERCTIAFNWFVNHADFDRVAVDHLMVMSHMFFGGWHVAQPAFPKGFLEQLLSHDHHPTLWFPFYFEPLVARTPELAGHHVNYLLLEKPFKEFAEDAGRIATDLGDFLLDAHTGVLTAGYPLARWLGCTEITLVGCDASYGRTEQDYFYATEQHTSLSTNESSLHAAWEDGGAAHYCYELAVREAADAGVAFCDATIDGHLTVVPKVDISGFRR